MNSFIREIPGAGGGGQRPRAGESGAEDHADARQLILGLNHGELRFSVRSDPHALEVALAVFGEALSLTA